MVKMVPFRLNNPDIIGYSVCRILEFNGRSIAMHAHTRGEDIPYDQLQIGGIPLVWQYMPVDSGEVVAEIWTHEEPDAGKGLMVMLCPTRPRRHSQH